MCALHLAPACFPGAQHMFPYLPAPPCVGPALPMSPPRHFPPIPNARAALLIVDDQPVVPCPFFALCSIPNLVLCAVLLSNLLLAFLCVSIFAHWGEIYPSGEQFLFPVSPNMHSWGENFPTPKSEEFSIIALKNVPKITAVRLGMVRNSYLLCVTMEGYYPAPPVVPPGRREQNSVRVLFVKGSWVLASTPALPPTRS